MKRANAREMRRRLDELETLLAAQVSLPDIYQHCEKEWGIGERMARKYIRKVYERWVEERDAARPYEKENLAQTLRLITSEAIADRRWHAAIRGTVELSKMLGHHVGEQVFHTGRVEHAHAHLVVPIDQMSAAEKSAEMKRLEQRRIEWLNSRGQISAARSED